MEDFLKFRKMITPVIIQIVFWIGVVLCVLVGIGLMIAGVVSQHGGGGQVLGGLLLLVFGPLVARIKCEILIVFFSINDTLTEIKNKMHDTIG